MKKEDELKFLEELQASEEFYTPFYLIQESNGYGKLTRAAGKVALKYLEPKEEGSLLFRIKDVERLFLGWGMVVL
ncbi:hypothetical protein [Flagellimonas okinawensis]|uniref:Uncharacterized protein n=1 Tax=Flagellimonas okinawensis TaxID=3031324 RepID=A0ABT5XL48_9FLAO|nr:hypothetical protein [[Muricauda] okinawensis]MDF0706606.1 hypothetical protein [[Muricauda] okinawensis]